MASTAFPLFSTIKKETQSTIEQAGNPHYLARSPFAKAVSCLPLLPRLWSVDHLLVRTNRTLSIGLGDIPADEIRKLADEVNQTHERTGEILTLFDGRLGLTTVWPYSRLLESIARRNDHLESIVEGLYLSLNDDFARFVGDTVEELQDSSARENPSCHGAK